MTAYACTHDARVHNPGAHARLPEGTHAQAQFFFFFFFFFLGWAEGFFFFFFFFFSKGEPREEGQKRAAYICNPQRHDEEYGAVCGHGIPIVECISIINISSRLSVEA